MPAEMGGEAGGCVLHLGIFHQNTSLAGLSNGPPPWGVDSGLHVLLLLAFPKIRLATVLEPHHPSLQPPTSAKHVCADGRQRSADKGDE